MQNKKNQFGYFQDLEKSTKAGLIAYLYILVAGLSVSIAGIEKTIRFITSVQLCETMFIILLTINIIQLLIKSVNKINWLGEAHLWVDNAFFKFLQKSNLIIIKELLILLEPKERSILDQLGVKERSTIARSIFSHLAEEQSLFESLLKRGIFRSWIWYWILIYGLLVFIILLVISFTKTLFEPTIYSKALFVSIGSVAFFHFLISILFGYNILAVTQRIIKEITDLYKVEIISVLKKYVKRSN